MAMISVWRLADDEQIAELAHDPQHLEELLDEGRGLPAQALLDGWMKDQYHA